MKKSFYYCKDEEIWFESKRQNFQSKIINDFDLLIDEYLIFFTKNICLINLKQGLEFIINKKFYNNIKLYD